MKRATFKFVCAVLVFGVSSVATRQALAQFPCTCVLWQLYNYDNTNYLWYADYYQSACTDQPQVAYWYGSVTSWPQICSACQRWEDGRLVAAAGNAGSFPGMKTPILSTDKTPALSGKWAQYARVVTDSDIPFVRILANGNPHVAKVFLLALDVDGAKNDVANGPDRFIYVAEEVSDTTNVPVADAKTPVSSHPLSNERACYAYDCDFQIGTNVIHVLVLLAQPQPTQEPTPAK
jgi:hypothetical protein